MSAAIGTPHRARTIPKRVVEQLELARTSYLNDRWVEAGRYAESALQMDPTNQIGLYFSADAFERECRTLREPKDHPAACIKAIAANKRLLQGDSAATGAYSTIVYLYDRLEEVESSEQWDSEIANNGALPNEVRIRALKSLMSKRQTCADLGVKGGFTLDPPDAEEPPVPFDASENRTKLEAAMKCGEQGLEYADAVLALGGGESWWERRALLDNLATVSERLNRPESALNFRRRATAAGEQLVREQTAWAERRALLSTVPDPVFDQALFLNRFVVSMPKPVLPATARAANVSGTVYLQIATDEHGFVVSAEPLVGPILLRATAARMARWARIDTARTTLNTGILLVEFKPES